MKKKWLIACLILAAFNIAFIWGNSLMPREISSAFSKLVGSILDFLLPGSATTSEGTGQGILRKIAHFTEFCSLGMLVCFISCLLNAKVWMQWGIPAGVGVAVAAIDETIQYFIPGRGPQLRDVGIDSLGVVLGICVAMLLIWLKFRRQKRNT